MGKPLRLWLNRGVRDRIENRPSDSRARSRNALLWLLTLVGLLGIGWIWWHSGQTSAPAPEPRTAPALRSAQVVIPIEPAPVRLQTQLPPPVAPIPAPRPIPKSDLEPAPPAGFPRPVRDVFEAQLALAQQGISSGSIDGRIGSQTRAALRAFQQQEHLAVTGELDSATKERLLLTAPPYATYTISADDLGRLQPLSPTWLGKSQQTALEHETLLELVAEIGHAHPDLIRQLNPSFSRKNLAAGATVQLPAVAYPDPSAKAAFATISLTGRILETFDANKNLLTHFPCSIGQQLEKRPLGKLHVAVLIPNPNYSFDPDVFPESAEARQLQRKLVLPPGPNNPVGVAWIGLDKPGYGIHGTPSPEQVGRTQSHGCFRLANWNAAYLLKLAWVGMPVYVEP